MPAIFTGNQNRCYGCPAEVSSVSVAIGYTHARRPSCTGSGLLLLELKLTFDWFNRIQARIARRAVELLQYGGIMVYSTCSLNPVENEAVVANLLLRFKDQIELVDARDQLKGLKTAQGLLSWNLMAKTGEIFDKPEQAAASQYANLMRPTMFPPEASVAKELNLDRCIRILPHHQNTGGFFIAVIRKLPLNQHVTKLLDSTKIDPNAAEASSAAATEVEKSEPQGPPEADSRKMKAPPAKRLKHVYDENPFQFFSEENPLLTDWPKIKYPSNGLAKSAIFPLNSLLTSGVVGTFSRSQTSSRPPRCSRATAKVRTCATSTSCPRRSELWP